MAVGESFAVQDEGGFQHCHGTAVFAFELAQFRKFRFQGLQEDFADFLAPFLAGQAVGFQDAVAEALVVGHRGNSGFVNGPMITPGPVQGNRFPSDIRSLWYAPHQEDRMRTVSYFIAGTVADFAIPDDRFVEFTKQMPFNRQHQEGELQKARLILDAFTRRASDEPAGTAEILAACYVWNFFNTNPDDEQHIKGDVVIVDLDGNGETIEYASVADIQMAPADH